MRIQKLIFTIFIVLVITTSLMVGTFTARAKTLEEGDAPYDGYIVKFSMPYRTSFLSVLSDELEPVPYSDNLYLTDDIKNIENLMETGLVEYVEPNYILEPLSDPPTPNDPRFKDQWTLDAINYLSLYNGAGGGYKGENVTVAVIDSGLYTWHEEFETANISDKSRNFLGTGGVVARSHYYRDQAKVGHGTFVTSQIAAITNNGKGIAGIADKVDLMILRCISDSGSQVFAYDDTYDKYSGSVALVASAIIYAADNGADVINLSLGGKTGPNTTLQDAINYAHSKGVIMIAAAGNDGTSTLFYPAACDNVIGVASVSRSEASYIRSGFSQYNTSVSVAAPGGAVLGASVYPSSNGVLYQSPEASYISSNGTSYSSPVVAALAAIVKSINKDFDYDDFEAILAISSRDLGTSGWDVEYGYGLLDAEKILKAMTNDEYGIEYDLCDNSTELAQLPSGSPTTYALDRSESLTLPTPSWVGHTFEGWYRSEHYIGEPVSVLPLGDLGILRSSVVDGVVSYYIEDLKFYAKWSENPVPEIQSITVLGDYKASLLDESDGKTYHVTIPKSAIDNLKSLTAEDISVASSVGSTTINKANEDGSEWTIDLGDPPLTYTLRINHSAYNIPAVNEGSSIQSGEALLPSLDGLQGVQVYSADISSWFTDATAYLIVSSDGGGEAKIEASTLTYVPNGFNGDYKDQKVKIVLKGKNDDFESSGTVIVTVTIGRHLSNSVITPVSKSYDLYTNSDGVGLNISLYGNIFTGIKYGGNTVSQSNYTTVSDDEIVDSIKVTLSHSFLSSLQDGINNIEFNFSNGVPSTLALTISDSAPKYSVNFYKEKGDLSTPFSRTTNIRKGSKLTLPVSEPTKTGYIFLGWYLSDDTTRVTANTVVNNDFDAFAKWSQESGTSSGGGGGGGAVAPPPSVPTTPPVPPMDALDNEKNDTTISVIGGALNTKVAATIRDDLIIIEPLPVIELENIINAATGEGKPVSIDLSSLGTKPTNVIIPKQVLSGVEDSKGIGMDITMPDGRGVTFDNMALRALTSAGSGDLKLGVREVDNNSLSENQRSLVGGELVIDLTAYIGTRQIHDFGGGLATISIPLKGKPKDHPIVWRMTTDVNGKVNLEAIECTYNPVTKCYEFQTGTFSKYVLGSYPFKDTPSKAWYYEDVIYAYMNGLFSGTKDTSFSPDMAMTRAMLVTVLWRMEDNPKISNGAIFSDLAPNTWYVDAVLWAAENKIVSGYGNGNFGPQDNISRQQLAEIMYRYAQYKKYEVKLDKETDVFSYKDAETISKYAIPAMEWACGTNLIKGSDGNLNPQGDATRAQLAAILHRFMENIIK